MIIKRLTVLLFILLFLPAISSASAKKHPPVPADQDCEECHSQEYQVWQDGKHGLMGVKCVVCHGDTVKHFIKKPGPDRCVGCHADQVNGSAEGHKIKPKSCWSCHEGHSLKQKSGK